RAWVEPFHQRAPSRRAQGRALPLPSGPRGVSDSFSWGFLFSFCGERLHPVQVVLELFGPLDVEGGLEVFHALRKMTVLELNVCQLDARLICRIRNLVGGLEGKAGVDEVALGDINVAEAEE